VEYVDEITSDDKQERKGILVGLVEYRKRILTD
jgi:hypothetical protein